MEATPYTQNFVCWILNFQVNLRKKISLEPRMKLKSLVNEVFFYQNMSFYMQKLFVATSVAAAKKLLKKQPNFVN